MKLPYTAAVSVMEMGAQTSEHNETTAYIQSVRDYYTQLKSPYLSSQNYIRQRIQAENEQLRLCQAEILLNGDDKKKVARLKEKATHHQFEMAEMESGLNWAASKIRELDQEMEQKIQRASGWSGSRSLAAQAISSVANLA